MMLLILWSPFVHCYKYVCVFMFAIINNLKKKLFRYCQTIKLEHLPHISVPQHPKVFVFHLHTIDTTVCSDLHLHTYMSNCTIGYLLQGG